MVFSELLTTYIEHSGKTELTLAKLCGFSRSYIALIKNGQRIPTRKKLELLISALELSPQESTRLWVQWEICKDSPGIGVQRQEFFNIIRDLSVFTGVQNHINLYADQNLKNLRHDSVVCGRGCIQEVISLIIFRESMKENGEIICTLQDPETLTLGNQFYLDIKINMILCMESCQVSRTGQIENIILLRKCLHMSMLCADYVPLYYYGAPATLRFSALPYIIRTSDAVMQLSDNLDFAIIHTETETLKLWTKLQEQQLRLCKHLWKELSCADMASEWIDYQNVCIIGATALLDVIHVWENIARNRKDFRVTVYFSEKMFKSKIDIQNSNRYENLKKTIVQNKVLKQGICETYCIDEKYLTLPDGLVIISADNKLLIWYSNTKKSIQITESSLTVTIHNILMDLKDSIYVSDFKWADNLFK